MPPCPTQRTPGRYLDKHHHVDRVNGAVYAPAVHHADIVRSRTASTFCPSCLDVFLHTNNKNGRGPQARSHHYRYVNQSQFRKSTTTLNNRMIKESSNLLSSTHGPHIEDIDLIHVVHEGIEHVDEPCVASIGGIRGRRPIKLELHMAESLRIQPCCGIGLVCVYQTFQFVDVRQPPVGIAKITIGI